MLFIVNKILGVLHINYGWPLCVCLQEAVAIVLDVGPSMTQASPGEQSHLQVSLEAINMILQRKVCYQYSYQQNKCQS